MSTPASVTLLLCTPVAIPWEIGSVRPRVPPPATKCVFGPVLVVAVASASGVNGWSAEVLPPHAGPLAQAINRHARRLRRPGPRAARKSRRTQHIAFSIHDMCVCQRYPPPGERGGRARPWCACGRHGNMCTRACVHVGVCVPGRKIDRVQRETNRRRGRRGRSRRARRRREKRKR